MTDQFQKTVCDNGIRVLSERMDCVQSVSIGVWICSGSRDELKKQNGIFHLMEHMVFKGTRSRSAYEIATSIESLGGYLNAFTEREFVCYYALILDDNVGDAVDVIADIIQHAVYDKKDLNKEKKIIFEEIQNLEDIPEDFIQDDFVQTVFDHDTLGFSTLGSNKSIQKIERNDLLEHQKQFYISSNIIVAASGKVNHEHLVALVDKAFHFLNSGTIAPRKSFKLGSLTSKKITSPIKQAHICTGMPAYSYRDPRKYVLIVFNTILGSGMSSRLFQRIRERKGLAYSIYSFLDFWSDTGLLGIYVGTSPKKSQEVVELIQEELNSLSSRMISKDELERTKSQLTRNLILMSDDCTNRMNRLAKMENYIQDYIPIENLVSNIEKVSEEDIRHVAYELVEKKERYTTILGIE